MIKPSCDRKTKFHKGQKNTYGLMPGPFPGTCPGATTDPGGCWHFKCGRKTPECYVTKILGVYKGVKGVLTHNTELLRDLDLISMQIEIVEEFARFKRAELRRAAQGHKAQLYYRLHWSGDIYNKRYALALKSAMKRFPDIRFWGYTRSFEYLNYFQESHNLSLYLSLDQANKEEGLRVYREWSDKIPSLRICYMGKEPDLDKRTVKNMKACPVDAGKMETEGGCAKCRLCYRKNPAHIWFRT